MSYLLKKIHLSCLDGGQSSVWTRHHLSIKEDYGLHDDGYDEQLFAMSYHACLALFIAILTALFLPSICSESIVVLQRDPSLICGGLLIERCILS